MSQETSKKILIVDDDPSILQLITHYLKDQKNLSLRTFLDEYDCVKSIGFDPPDLIILDIKLNYTSGFNIAELVGETTSNDIPIIFISSQENKEAALQNIFSSQRIAFLHKPFSQQTLLEKINEFLEK